MFQGTVWGPSLWNAFSADISVPANSTGGRAAKFADDLNVFHKFDKKIPLVEMQSVVGKCRDRVHKWGKTYKVTFDASKEHVVIIHPSLNHGDSFKLLGCTMDTDLRMQSAIEQMLSKVRPKVTAILRTRAYYPIPELVNQFKTHVWGLMEAHSGGIFHAASTLLQKIDHVQSRFLRELDLSPECAFLELNFAPPSLRRRIAILGLMHKRVLGKCHPSFDFLLPF